MPFECPRCIGRHNDGGYDCSVLRSDPHPDTARRIRELLNTYKAAPAISDLTMPGTEDQTALAVMKLYQPALVQVCVCQ